MAELLGKERDVNSTIIIVKNILKKVGFNLIEKDLINPIVGIWSVNLQDNDSHFYTNGKGSTKEACLASAYCEFLERFGSGFFFNDFAIDGLYQTDNWVYSPDETYTLNNNKYKNNLLTQVLWDFYDPENILNFDNFIDSGRCTNDKIISLPFINNKNGKSVNFPIELLKTIYVSNGLSAGNTEHETLIQGMCECIERGIKNYIIKEGLSLPTIDDDYLDKLGYLDIKKSIESYGYPVLVKDASLNGRFPVICVLLLNQKTGTVLSSFGCHPNLSVAIDRTLTELLQGRKIDSLDGFSTLSNDIDEVSDEANIESHFINSTGVLHINIVKENKDKCSLWNFKKNDQDEMSYLINILDIEGYDYFYRSIHIEDMWISQTIIPQLSEIYPIEDLEYEYKNRALILRDFMKKDCDVKWVKKSLAWFDESYVSEDSYVMEFMGISIGKNDNLFNLLVIEIELLMLIRTKNFKGIKNILCSRIDFNNIDNKRVGFWRCFLSYLIELPPRDLILLYGQNSYDLVLDSMNGIIPRELYPLLNKDFSKIKNHRELNGVYKKYRQLFS